MIITLKEVVKFKLVVIKEVSKIYNLGENEVRALDNISLEIESGDFIAIVGQSGSGKSTLMNIIGLLDTPTSGVYHLNGHDVSNLDDDTLSDIRNREIGFIFQGFNLISSLTACENVELPLVYRGIKKPDRKSLSLEALKKTGLENRIHHLPCQLSGGQQQRVAIARALAASPPIILADEPTGNLDSTSGKEVIKTLLELNDDGKTVILITHDEQLAKLAKRIIRIQDGKIVSNKNIDDCL